METLVQTTAASNKSAISGGHWLAKGSFPKSSYLYMRHPTSSGWTSGGQEPEDSTSHDSEDIARRGAIVISLHGDVRTFPTAFSPLDVSWDAEHTALHDPQKTVAETNEEGFPAPSENALPNSDRLFGEMYVSRQIPWPHFSLWELKLDALCNPEDRLGLKVIPYFLLGDEETFATAVTSDDSSWNGDLYAALHDLRQATEEAAEEGFPVPSENALASANRLLREMYRVSRRRFEVYPTQDGEVAIDAPGGYGRSVVLLCNSEGGALCLVNMNGEHRRARYSTTEMLPDGFVREALAELDQQGSWVL